MMSLMRSSCFMLRFLFKTKKVSHELRSVVLPLEAKRLFHTTGQHLKKKNEPEKNTLMTYVFENADEKKKETYLDILRIYEKQQNKRGEIQFIKLALKYMKVFGVHRDLESYKAILNVLPKGPYIPTNYYQVLSRYYPKHQDVGVEVLEQMECNRVMPDRELESILLNIYGKHGLPLKKFWRMLYWMPKFAHLNPWPVPRPIPTDPRVLARIAIRKISSADITTNIFEFNTVDIEDEEEYVEDTWIISAISPIQQDLLVKHSKFKKEEALFVEGPYKVWVADQSVDYFVLRGNPEEILEKHEDIDDVSNLKIPFWKTREVIPEPTIHEQKDGIYFAVCATGTSSKDSAVSWIRCLQRDNPVLKDIPILIKLASASDTECIEIKGTEKNLKSTVNDSK